VFVVTVSLSSDEWVRIRNSARTQWPQECLSHAEILRRHALFGVQSFKSVPQADQSRLQHAFQASMTIEDTRMKAIPFRTNIPHPLF
jgi:hypothetical protein